MGLLQRVSIKTIAQYATTFKVNWYRVMKSGIKVGHLASECVVQDLVATPLHSFVRVASPNGDTTGCHPRKKMKFQVVGQKINPFGDEAAEIWST